MRFSALRKTTDDSIINLIRIPHLNDYFMLEATILGYCTDGPEKGKCGYVYIKLYVCQECAPYLSIVDFEKSDEFPFSLSIVPNPLPLTGIDVSITIKGPDNNSITWIGDANISPRE